MNPSLIIKLVSYMLGVGAIAGCLLYVKNLIGDNAILKESVKAAAEYSIRVEDEVQAYSYAVTVLGERDQESRDKRNETFKTIENHDLTKMSERHPDNLLSILNARTKRMLVDVSNSSRPGSSKTTSPTTTRANSN